MDKRFIEKQEEAFDLEQKAFEAAKAKYYQALKKYQAFHDEKLLLSPPLNRAAYSDRTCWLMAVLSRLAYIPFEESEDNLAQLEFNLKSGGFELVRTFSKSDTQAILVRNKSFAVLAFRGTEIQKIGDILTDIRAYQNSTKSGRVHAGFEDAYEAIAQEIDNSLVKDEWPIYITGHSLGGALATVATQILEHRFGDLISACYTFGSPRVGNRTYEKNIKPPFYRVVNSTDIVTLVPNIGYTHVGDTRFLSIDGDLYRGIPFFRRGWEMFLALFAPARWVTCHSIEEYCDKLENYAVKRNS